MFEKQLFVRSMQIDRNNNDCHREQKRVGFNHSEVETSYNPNIL